MSFEIHTQRRIKDSLLATTDYRDVAETIALALAPKQGPITVQNDEGVVGVCKMEVDLLRSTPTSGHPFVETVARYHPTGSKS